MMAMFAFPCVSLLLSLAAGYPSSMQCDFACMANYGPGASFGYMGIANVGATSGATCAIATDVPTEGFTGGSSYTITDEMWYADEISVSCAATTTGTSTSGDTTTVTHTVTGTSTGTTEDSTGTTATVNGAKSLTCWAWGIGMAIYSWLF